MSCARSSSTCNASSLFPAASIGHQHASLVTPLFLADKTTGISSLAIGQANQLHSADLQRTYTRDVWRTRNAHSKIVFRTVRLTVPCGTNFSDRSSMCKNFVSAALSCRSFPMRCSWIKYEFEIRDCCHVRRIISNYCGCDVGDLFYRCAAIWGIQREFVSPWNKQFILHYSNCFELSNVKNIKVVCDFYPATINSKDSSRVSSSPSCGVRGVLLMYPKAFLQVTTIRLCTETPTGEVCVFETGDEKLVKFACETEVSFGHPFSYTSIDSGLSISLPCDCVHLTRIPCIYLNSLMLSGSVTWN